MGETGGKRHKQKGERQKAKAVRQEEKEGGIEGWAMWGDGRQKAKGRSQNTDNKMAEDGKEEWGLGRSTKMVSILFP